MITQPFYKQLRSLCAVMLLSLAAVALAQSSPKFLWRHGFDAAGEARISPDGRLIATTGNRVVNVFDAITGKCINALSGITPPINSLCWLSQDTLAVTDSGGWFTIWNALNSTNVKTIYTTTNDDFRALATNSTGSLVAALDYGGVISLYDVATGSLVRKLPKLSSANVILMTPDGTRTVANTSSAIRVYENATGNLLKTMTGHSGLVRSLAVTRNSRYLLSGSNDQRVKLWDILNGTLITTFPTSPELVTDVAFSYDESRVLAVGGNVRVYDRTTAALQSELSPYAPKRILSSPLTDRYYVIGGEFWLADNLGQEIRALARGIFARSVVTDGEIFAERQNAEFRRWQDFSLLRSISLPSRKTQLYATNDGSLISYGDQSFGRSHSATNGQIVRTFGGLLSVPTIIQYSPNLKYAITAGLAQSYLWNVSTMQRISQLPVGTTVVKFTNDSSKFILGTSSGLIYVYSADTGAIIHNINAYSEKISAIALNEDDSIFYTSCRSSKWLKSWSMELGTQLLQVELPSGSASVLSTERNGDNLLAADEAGNLSIWRLPTLSQSSSLTPWSDGFGMADFSADSRYIICWEPVVSCVVNPTKHTGSIVVKLLDFLGFTIGVPINIEIYEPGQSEPFASCVSAIQTDGRSPLVLGPLPDGVYDMRVKAPHWLAQRLNGISLVNGESGATFQLKNGDVDGDNVVGIFDYLILSQTWGLDFGDPNWNDMDSPQVSTSRADLDGDGMVSLFDYLILSDAFDQSGD